MQEISGQDPFKVQELRETNGYYFINTLNTITFVLIRTIIQRRSLMMRMILMTMMKSHQRKEGKRLNMLEVLCLNQSQVFMIRLLFFWISTHFIQVSSKSTISVSQLLKEEKLRHLKEPLFDSKVWLQGKKKLLKRFLHQ